MRDVAFAGLVVKVAACRERQELMAKVIVHVLRIGVEYAISNIAPASS